MRSRDGTLNDFEVDAAFSFLLVDFDRKKDGMTMGPFARVI